MSLVNNTFLHMTTGLLSDPINAPDTTVEEIPVKVIEHDFVAYVEVNQSGIYLTKHTLEHLMLMLELHQRRIDTV